MITELRIRSFKRFSDQIFPMRPLTVLTGLNGSGKTSVIHSLLLASEASGLESGDAIRLNGPFGIELGDAEEVRNWSSNELIEFHVTSNEDETEIWKIGIPSGTSRYLTVEEAPQTSLTAFGKKPRTFSYLCAERLGPRNVSPTSPLPIDKLEIGVSGEYCAQIFGTLGSRPIEFANRIHPLSSGEPTSLLKYEVERWLAEIARPVELDTIQYPGTAYNAMQFRFSGQDWVRAPNMGFGISYALPVILSGLIIETGGLFIVENPEAHLHPAGQSRMGVFLAWLASCGVQVIVETHSDHVLNGMRRAIGEYQYLAHTDALVHFFNVLEDDSPQVERLEFTPVGGISHWPKGFFDQYQIDIASLGRVRRRK